MIYSLLYIDPGTGSMLFSLFIGIATAAVFGAKALFVKLKFILSGGKASNDEQKDVIPYVIFSDHKRYWNVFGPICEEFEKRKIPLVYYTASEDDPVFKQNYSFVKPEYLGEGNKPYAKLNFLKADKVIATTPGLDVYQWKRSKGVKNYIHIPHSVDDLAGYRMFGLDHYDTVLTTGENQNTLIRKIESLRPSITKKELKTVGCTYLDTNIERLDSIKTKKNNDKTVVLIAPSWGPSAILSKFGDKLLNALSKTDFEVIIRPHPQTVITEKNILEPLQNKYTNMEWNYDIDNFEVLNKSDILITDFSGIIFDFSLVFDKPLLYADTSFNTLPYDADWLDEPMWALRILPEIGFKLEEKDFNNITDIINKAISSKDMDKARAKIRDSAWVNRRNSAKIIVDYLTK